QRAEGVHGAEAEAGGGRAGHLGAGGAGADAALGPDAGTRVAARGGGRLAAGFAHATSAFPLPDGRGPRARPGCARSARLRALGPGPRSAASEEVLQGAVVGAGDGERVLVGDRDVLDRVGALVALLRLPLAGPRVALLPV